ncbi:hypothetical protein E3N88_22781 [Mikania micrantha]|uniref:RWD domain-containing protein n=1 Tax=Mikania micrantha TaxID=192012 RepID=A0A5N6ND50_9ASTR|nr:hypothetical protein E3N88_22781 [Mikania micrantha]
METNLEHTPNTTSRQDCVLPYWPETRLPPQHPTKHQWTDVRKRHSSTKRIQIRNRGVADWILMTMRLCVRTTKRAIDGESGRIGIGDITHYKSYNYNSTNAEMTDHLQEQEMEIEALEAILMDEFQEIHPSESGLNTSNRCFQITLSPQDDETDESSTTPVQLGLIFSHTEKYPDEIPLLNVRSIRGIHTSDLKVLKEKLEQEASENLGMAMIYTLVSSAKDWLSERFAQNADDDDNDEDVAEKDEVIVPHGEPVTIDTFLAWRERFEAELALERAKLMPESALATPKEKRLTGRQWFESGRASSAKGTVAVDDEFDEEDEDFEFDDDDDFEDDEEDMLEHYLAEKDSSVHSSSRAV